MAAIHITDIEAAINFWREKKPSPDGVTLAPEVRALAEVYALMVFYREDEVDEVGFPAKAWAAWLGWYETTPSFSVARDAFVVGDAIDLPYRAGFATAWQARRVLRALGGDLARLGPTIDGIPSDAVEYQMDLADGVLHARIDCADTLSHPFLGYDAEIDVAPGARPDKLVGLLLHDRVLRWDSPSHDAALAYRDLLSGREVA